MHPFKIVKLCKCDKYIVCRLKYDTKCEIEIFLPNFYSAKSVCSKGKKNNYIWDWNLWLRLVENSLEEWWRLFYKGSITWNASYSQWSATKDFLSRVVISWKWCFGKLNSDGCIRKIVPKEETPRNNKLIAVIYTLMILGFDTDCLNPRFEEPQLNLVSLTFPFLTFPNSPPDWASFNSCCIFSPL